MGQILDRVINLAKANKSNRKGDFYFQNDDDELKRIIDELNVSDNRQTAESRRQTGGKGEGKKSFDKFRMTDEVMTVERAYRILKIGRNATQEEIKKAYIERIKEYHPDRLESFGEDLKELAMKRTQEINQAYSMLKG